MVEFMVNVPMVTSSAGPPRQDKKLLQAFVGQARKYLEHMWAEIFNNYILCSLILIKFQIHLILYITAINVDGTIIWFFTGM